MSNTENGISADKLELYENLVATNPQVERKGASVPYTSLNGHMFSFLTKSGNLALRLPSDERDAFLKKYKTTLCEQHGTIMKEYVLVPDTLLRKTRELKKYFELSFNYVSSLKPKATKKKKATTRTASKKKGAMKKIPMKKAAKKKAVKKAAQQKAVKKKIVKKSATKKKAHMKKAAKKRGTR